MDRTVYGRRRDSRWHWCIFTAETEKAKPLPPRAWRPGWLVMGKRCCSFSFFKGGETGEINLFLGLPQFQILRSEKPFPFTFQMGEAQKQELREIHNGLLRQAPPICGRLWPWEKACAGL